MTGTLSLIHGNALAIPLANQSVHLIVTSPPYYALRSYRDGDEHYEGQLGSEPTPHHFLANLWTVLDECWRVLRDDGSAWINLGDRFAGSGGNNNAGVGGSKRGPSRYNQNTGDLRTKSRMLLPHRFALGLIDPDYRAFTEHRAGLTPTADPPQWICRMDVVWSKLNGLPESVTDRVRASHEYWLHFVKSERYFAAMDEIREEQTAAHIQNHYTSEPPRDQRRLLGKAGLHDFVNPLGKLPGSVWSVATEPLQIPDDLPQHFAAFPSEFPRRIVLGWSPSGVCVACGEPRRPVCESSRVKSPVHGDGSIMGNRNGGPDERGWDGLPRFNMERAIIGYVCACPTPDAPTTPARVLDPFSGTGTAPIVAAALGRHGVGVDLSWDYHRIARWRDQDGGLRAKALGVERPERQLDGQTSLFDDGWLQARGAVTPAPGVPSAEDIIREMREQ